MKKLLVLAIALLIATGLSACADTMVIGNESGDPRFLDTNFLVFEHPFTDKGTAEARTRAERLCSQQKRLAIQTERACTLTQCTTSYQCVAPKDAKAYGL